MSMMVNSVSNVSFRAAAPVSEDFLSRPGSFSKPEQYAVPASTEAPKKKNNSALKVIIGTVIAAAAILGGLYAAHKYAGKTFDAAKNFEEFKDLDFIKKAQGYVTTAIGKGGEKVEKGVNYITTECKGLWNKLFNSTPKPAAEPPAV